MGLVERKCKWVFLGGGWAMESGGGQARGGWINESVYFVSVEGWVCVCRGLECWPWSWVGLNVSRKE